MTTARLYALAELSALYHGGQFTREYRIGCRAERLLERRGIVNALDQVHKGMTLDTWPAEFMAAYRREYQSLLIHFAGEGCGWGSTF